MKKIILIGLFFFVLSGVFAQNWLWKADVSSFFDNTEFSGSNLQNSQTMAGIRFAPEIGLQWDKKHRVYVGLDAMHEFGSTKTIDFFDPVAYYEYNGKPFRFYMGAVPRKTLLDKYPRMFFQDSIAFYRPVMNGFFWEYGRKNSFANIWLDWTGRRSFERNEAFFMGWSGRYQYSVFYAQHFGTMFHFAGIDNPEINDAVHDNGLILTSLGVDLSKLIKSKKWKKLDFNAGWSVGLDRDRGAGFWNTPMGLLSELRIEYGRFGLFNTYYKGRGQQKYYKQYGSQLYWGDRAYRADEYNRADFYIRFLSTKVVNLKLTYSLHFLERQLFHEQMLTASFYMDSNN